MKSLLTLVFVIFPLITFGEYLDINGSYTCKGKYGTSDLAISTNFIDGVYTYEFTEANGAPEVFTADGKEWPFEEEVEEGIKVKGIFKTVCDAESLNVHMTGKVEGQERNTDLKITAKVGGEILYLCHRVLIDGRILDTMIEECTLK